MKKFFVILFTVVVAITASSTTVKSVEYNSYMRKSFRDKKFFDNKPDLFKSEVLLGSNPEKYLLVPLDIFDTQLRNRVAYYNSVEPYFDQIGDEELKEVIARLRVVNPTPGVKMLMTTYRNGQSVIDSRYPESGEQLLQFETWPPLISMRCANFRMEDFILPEPGIDQTAPQLAQNTPKQKGGGWRGSSSSSVSSSNSNSNTVNVYNETVGTQPINNGGENNGGNKSDGTFWKSAGGAAVGTAAVLIGKELLFPENRRNNNEKIIVVNGGNSRTTNNTTVRRRGRGGNNNGGGWNNGGPYQGGGGNSNGGNTGTPLPERPGQNGNIFGGANFRNAASKVVTTTGARGKSFRGSGSRVLTATSGLRN